MRASLAILCPGQGNQHPAMFDLVRTDPEAAALLQQWTPLMRLDAPLDELLTDPARLYANQVAQPLMVAAALTTWSALRESVPAPDLVAGYSIGELSAHAVAGALAGADAIALAATRARLMNACLKDFPGHAMAAVSGVLVATLAALVRGHGFHIAIATGDDSAIVGGLALRYADLLAQVTGMGGRMQLLPVEVASHTPYLQGAQVPFALALRQYPWSTPDMPVLAGISAARVDRADDAVSTLSRQLAETVRWTDCMDACAEAGITVALELGPGASLSRMLGARHPSIACRSVADFRTLEGVRRWLRSRLEH